MADYHVGSGQTYSTIAEALAAIVALGATEWTEDTRVIIHEGTYAETLDYGTTYGWNLGATPKYPLTFINNGSDVVTITGSGGVTAGQNYMSHVHIEGLILAAGKFNFTASGGFTDFVNCDITLNNSSNAYSNTNSPFSWPFRFKDCVINHTASLQMFVGANNNNNFDFIIDNCKVCKTTPNSFVYSLKGGSICARNSGFTNVRLMHASQPQCVEVRQCTFNGGVDESGLFDTSPVTSACIYNSIFKNQAAIFNNTGAGEDIYYDGISMDGNLYDTVTAFASGNTVIADLAAAKTAGIEGENSVTGSVTFQSVDITSNDYLKISASVGSSENVGLDSDYFGTAREKFSDIDPGYHQYTGATEPDPDVILKSSGGNYNDDNLIDSNVKEGVEYGIDHTGSYDPIGAATYDYIHWVTNDDGSVSPLTTPLDINYPDEEFVKLDVVYGALDQYTGTLTGGGTGESSAAPIITSVTPGNGQVAIGLTLNTWDNPAYVIYAVNADSAQWSLPSDSFKATEDGTVTITGLSNLIEYKFAAISKSGDIYSLPTRVIHSTPRTAQQASGFSVMTAEATASLRAAKVMGVEVDFKNRDSDDYVSLWAIPNAGSSVLQLRNTSTTDTEVMSFTIPRQTNFPPTTFAPGALLRYDDAYYEIDNIIPSRGNQTLSGTFEVNCGRYRSISDV